MNAIGVNFAWCAVQISILTLAVWVLLIALRRSPPAVRSTLTMFGLAAVVLLSAFAIVPLPSWWDVGESLSFEELLAKATKDSAESETNGKSSSSPDSGDSVVDAKTNGGPYDDVGDPSRRRSFLESWSDSFRVEAAQDAPVAIARDWPRVVAVLLIAMWVIGSWNVAAGLLTVRRYLLRSVPVVDQDLLELVDLVRAELCCRQSITLYQCGDLSTAATTGWLRPAILLPPEWRTWTDSERRAVLAHEIAHVSRHDYLVSLGAQISLALHYYHPFLHWLVGRLRLEQELAADAAAAGVSGGQSAYVRILGDLALRQPDRRVRWPARLFLPTRRTFFRRIVMLRDESMTIISRSRLWPATAVGLLLVAAVFAAGFRGPGELPAISETLAAEQESATESAESAPFDLRYFSEDFPIVIAVRPASLLEHEGMQRLLSKMSGSQRVPSGVLSKIDLLSKIDQYILSLPNDGRQELRCVIRSKAPHDWKEYIQTLETPRTKEYAGKSYLVSQNSLAVYRPDDRTIVVASEAAIRRLLDGKPPRQKIVGTSGWKLVQDAQVAVAVDHEVARKFQILSRALDNTDAVYIGANIGPHVELDAYYVCDDPRGAKEVADFVRGSLELGRDIVRNDSNDEGGVGTSDADRKLYIRLAARLLESAWIERIAFDNGDGKRRIVHIRSKTDFEETLTNLHAEAAVFSNEIRARSHAQ